jgi:hypothetical protein
MILSLQNYVKNKCKANEVHMCVIQHIAQMYVTASCTTGIHVHVARGSMLPNNSIHASTKCVRSANRFTTQYCKYSSMIASTQYTSGGVVHVHVCTPSPVGRELHLGPTVTELCGLLYKSINESACTEFHKGQKCFVIIQTGRRYMYP